MTGPSLEKLGARPSISEFHSFAWDSPAADFNAVFELNCTGVYYTILAFLELLAEGNKKPNHIRSQVIATASIAGFQRHPRVGFAYISSKAALISMIKTFATFAVPWEIRFNAIAAGLFPTDLSEQFYAPYRKDKNKPITEEGPFHYSYQPAGRAGSEEDIAGALMYLASRAGSFCNGNILVLDGANWGLSQQLTSESTSRAEIKLSLASNILFFGELSRN